MRLLAASLLVLGVAATSAAGQVQIDKRRPAKKNGVVYIENGFGSVKVIGWEKEEVAVTGTMAAGAEGVELDGDKESVSIDVSVPSAWTFGSDDDTDYRSNLQVSVPRGSSVQIQTVNAEIRVEGVEGALDLESVNGLIEVSGAPRAVDAETMTGQVLIQAAAAEMRVESVAGSITLRGAAREVQVRSVSGKVDVSGKDFAQVEIETTASDVQFEGGFLAEGNFHLETFSGNVLMVLPADVAARFHLETFSGQIESDIGTKPRRTERFNPYMEMRFTTGFNEFDVSAKTYSGNIKVGLSREAGGPPPKPPVPPKPPKPRPDKSDRPDKPDKADRPDG